LCSHRTVTGLPGCAEQETAASGEQQSETDDDWGNLIVITGDFAALRRRFGCGSNGLVPCNPIIHRVEGREGV